MIVRGAALARIYSYNRSLSAWSGVAPHRTSTHVTVNGMVVVIGKSIGALVDRYSTSGNSISLVGGVTVQNY